MKVRIQKASDGMYSAELFSLPTGPQRVKPEGITTAPMRAHDLCRELLARGLDPSEISNAFEEADPDLSPTPRNYVPAIGEEVLVVNHLGVFIVEAVDADAKTASLRVLRSGILMKDVEWCTIWPLDDKLLARLNGIIGSSQLQQILSRRNRGDD